MILKSTLLPSKMTRIRVRLLDIMWYISSRSNSSWKRRFIYLTFTLTFITHFATHVLHVYNTKNWVEDLPHQRARTDVLKVMPSFQFILHSRTSVENDSFSLCMAYSLNFTKETRVLVGASRGPQASRSISMAAIMASSHRMPKQHIQVLCGTFPCVATEQPTPK